MERYKIRLSVVLKRFQYDIFQKRIIYLAIGFPWNNKHFYDVTSCTLLEYILSRLKFGFEDNFIDRACLMMI